MSVLVTLVGSDNFLKISVSALAVLFLLEYRPRRFLNTKKTNPSSVISSGVHLELSAAVVVGCVSNVSCEVMLLLSGGNE